MVANWKRNGWKTAAKPVKNQDLWQALEAESAKHERSGAGSRDTADTPKMNAQMRWLIGACKQCGTVEMDRRQVVLDTETTGLEVPKATELSRLVV